MFESLFPSHWTTLKKLMWLKLKGAAAVWSTISGNPVSFTAKAAPLKQLQIAFSPVQSGSGDPSPDNVRPISGWDGVDIYLQSAYDPTAQPSISISFGSTVYSGTLDVLTGVVTVTHQSVDLGSLNWFVGGTITQDIKRMATSDISRTIKRPETSGVLVDMMCEAYATINGNQVYSKITGIGSNSQGDISVYDPNYNTAESVADFTASVNGVKLVFPLATPITIQLTPQEVESLAGDNVLFSDANGDLTVEYRSN